MLRRQFCSQEQLASWVRENFNRLGKVVLEKILRSLPNIKAVYISVTPKVRLQFNFKACIRSNRIFTFPPGNSWIV